LQLQLSDAEIEQRKKDRKPFEKATKRGYASLYINHVQQANLGADMDFLQGASGGEVLRDSH
jgi:dihydroxy-acid dehydratase